MVTTHHHGGPVSLNGSRFLTTCLALVDRCIQCIFDSNIDKPTISRLIVPFIDSIISTAQPSAVTRLYVALHRGSRHGGHIQGIGTLVQRLNRAAHTGLAIAAIAQGNQLAL